MVGNAIQSSRPTKAATRLKNIQASQLSTETWDDAKLSTDPSSDQSTAASSEQKLVMRSSQKYRSPGTRLPSLS